MKATLEQLVNIRSQLVEEVLAYLDNLAKEMATLPEYYPEHLRTNKPGATRFDDLRQRVQLKEEQSSYEQWRAEERERVRVAGMEYDDRRAYDPRRARPESAAPETIQRGFEHFTPPPQLILWDKCAGERFKHAVIVGDPGSGKTWLLRYEARRLAHQAKHQIESHAVRLEDLVFPIFMRLPELSAREEPIEEALVALIKENSPAPKPSEAFCHFVQKTLETGQCVILLDAWDEVPVSNRQNDHETTPRQQLKRRLKTFSHKFPQSRVLLTSRTIDFDHIHSPIPDAQKLELQAFDSPQIASFVRVWFGDDTEIASQFQAMLQQNHQVRGLARIPLMLTLMCLIYQEKQALPTRRVELFDYCVRGLLLRELKEKNKKRDDEPISEVSYIEAMLELLQGVSFTLFVENYERSYEPELRNKIEAWLDDLSLKRPHHEFLKRNRDATSLIAELKRDGILITDGEHHDAPLLFLHRTFHEFLTARYLAKLVNDKGWETQFEVENQTCTARTFVDKKAWDPHWQEVIILLAGQLEKEKKSVPLLETLADQKKDDLFRHRLALAILCLPELKPEIRDSQVGLISRITVNALSWWLRNQYIDSELQTMPFWTVVHLSRVLPGLGQVNSRVCSSPIRLWLAKQMTRIERATANTRKNDTSLIEFIREIAAFFEGIIGRKTWLSPVSTSTQDGVPLLEWLIEQLNDKNRYMRERAAYVVGTIGRETGSPVLLNHLTHLLHDPYSSVKVEAMKSLVLVGFRIAIEPEILTCLFNMLSQNTDATVMMAEARLREDIREVVAKQPRFFTYLADRLCTPDIRGRWTAAATLGSLGSVVLAEPGFLIRLADLLNNQEVSDFARAVKYQGSWNEVLPINPRFLSHLAELLREGTNAGEMLTIDPRENFRNTTMLLACLPKLLLDNDFEVVKGALEVIGELGSMAATPEILGHLGRMLRYNDFEVVKGALEVIGELGSVAATPEILNYLGAVLCCRNRSMKILAMRAIKGLGNAVATNPQILSCLAELLHDEDRFVQRTALKAVGNLGEAIAKQSQILDALADLLQDTGRAALKAVKVLNFYEHSIPEPRSPFHVAKLLQDFDKSWWEESVREDPFLGEGFFDRWWVELLKDNPKVTKDRTILEIVNLEQFENHLKTIQYFGDKESYFFENWVQDCYRNLEEPWLKPQSFSNFTDELNRRLENPLSFDVQLKKLPQDSDWNEEEETTGQQISQRNPSAGHIEGNKSHFRTLEPESSAHDALADIQRYVSFLHKKITILEGRLSIASQIGGIMAMEPKILELFTDLLCAPNIRIRAAAARTVGHLGNQINKQPDLLNRLINLLNDPAEEVRSAVAQAIGNLGGHIAIEPKLLTRLAKLWKDPEFSVRTEAAQAIRNLGSQIAQEPKPLTRLIKLLKSREVRKAAAYTIIESCGDMAFKPAILPRLLKILRTDRYGGVDRALTSLMKQQGVRIFKRRPWPFTKYETKTVTELSQLKIVKIED